MYLNDVDVVVEPVATSDNEVTTAQEEMQIKPAEIASVFICSSLRCKLAH